MHHAATVADESTENSRSQRFRQVLLSFRRLAQLVAPDAQRFHRALIRRRMRADRARAIPGSGPDAGGTI
jgi:hypothetical protein